MSASDAAKTAMSSPDHLKRWLKETGRRYIVLDAIDLVDAAWPHRIHDFMETLAEYRDHRRKIPTGHTVTEKMPDGTPVQVPTYKDEVLEVDELDRVIRHLIGLITIRDGNWSLNNPPL